MECAPAIPLIRLFSLILLGLLIVEPFLTSPSECDELGDRTTNDRGKGGNKDIPETVLIIHACLAPPLTSGSSHEQREGVQSQETAACGPSQRVSGHAAHPVFWLSNMLDTTIMLNRREHGRCSSAGPVPSASDHPRIHPSGHGCGSSVLGQPQAVPFDQPSS